MENPETHAGDTPEDEESEDSAPQYKRTGPRVAISKVTGKSYVTARPGAPLVTSEMVRKELEDFP